MLSYVLDPLIAEAKRRARRRRLLVVAAFLVVIAAGGLPLRGAFARAGASPALASSGVQCTPNTAYGSQCVEVRGSGLTVAQIRTSFDDTPLLWPNLKWRIDLERYGCDPIGKTKSMCWATATWHGEAREGVPTPGNRYPPDVHFAQSRSGGYWSSFSLPHTFGSNAWLCAEVAVYNRATGKWVYNGRGLAHGLRACVSVHA
jgi:hypothetical protein